MDIMNMLMVLILVLMKLLLLDGMKKGGLLKILLVFFGGIIAFLKLNLKIILDLVILLLLMKGLFILKCIYCFFY